MTTLVSAGIRASSRSLRRRDTRALRLALRATSPDLEPFLASLAPWARYQDICLVHAGWPQRLSDIADFTPSFDRLWVRSEFYDGPALDSRAYEAFARAGLHRAVIGHTPMRAPTALCDGKVLVLDTNACANPHAWGWKENAAFVLAGLPGDGSPLTESRIVRIPTAGAPDGYAKQQG